MEPSNRIEQSRMSTEDFSSTLFCAICKCFMKEPVECTTCKSIFCKTCIESWLILKKKCPNNCRDFTIKKTYVLIDKIINSTKVKCQNHDQGCLASVPYEELKTHQSTCKYRTLPCTYSSNGCKEKLIYKNKQTHEAECEYRSIECSKHCGESLCKKNEISHNCIRTFKNKVMEYKNQIDNISNDLNRMKCKLYQVQYQNIGVGCNNCNQLEFPGTSYKCNQCNNFDLCSTCYKIASHAHPMSKLVPFALYTEVIHVHREQYDVKRNRIDVVLMVVNFEDEDFIVRFTFIGLITLNYLDNNYFEIRSGESLKRVFSFSIDKDLCVGSLTFYIDRINCKRQFGLPFDVKLVE